VTLLAWLQECGGLAGAAVGGKAAGLAASLAAGLPVPPGFVVTTEAFRHSLTELPAPESAREAVLAAEIDAEVARAICARYRELGEDVAVAVRSSAVAEDASDASFAGEHETYLWVVGEDEVLDAVRRCWASLFGERALSYRSHERIDAPWEMAVVIQQMAPARSAGVMFTLNPENGDRSKIAIESVWGLGEGFVSGELTPDFFLLDKVTGDVLRREVRAKTHEVARAAGGGVETRAVADELASQPSLSDEELGELRRIGRVAEKHVGAPVDVEWAVVEDSQIWVLQVRPETVWTRRAAEQAAPATPASALDQVVARLSGGKS